MEKEIAKWNKQSERDIWDEIVPWDIHYFVCVMSDSSIQIFMGSCDEDCDGNIYEHLYCEKGCDEEDIVLWMEVENPNLEHHNK